MYFLEIISYKKQNFHLLKQNRERWTRIMWWREFHKFSSCIRFSSSRTCCGSFITVLHTWDLCLRVLHVQPYPRLNSAQNVFMYLQFMAKRIKVIMKVFEKFRWTGEGWGTDLLVGVGGKEAKEGWGRRITAGWEVCFLAPAITRGRCYRIHTAGAWTHTDPHLFEGFLPATQVNGSLKSARQ